MIKRLADALTSKTVDMPRTIAILEDDTGRTSAMRELLDAHLSQFEHRFFISADAMIEWLAIHLDHLLIISLDHDLEPIGQANPGTGRIVADYLAMKKPRCPVIIHSTNRHAVVGMKQTLEDAEWLVTTVMPYEDLQWVGEAWWPLMLQSIQLLTDSEEESIEKA